jgi:hypothetical protein
MKAPESHGFAMKVYQACNYLQAVEGGIDSSHIDFLHRDTRFWIKKDVPSTGNIREMAGQRVGGILFKDTAPGLEVETTRYGFRYAGLRRSEGHQYVRITPFIMPWHTYVPGNNNKAFFHAWVPRDDYSCWTWDFHYKLDGPMSPEEQQVDVNNRGLWLDESFRSKRSRENNWLQDRSVMKAESFTGIAGIANQDQGVQESMGAIFDRTKEHLGTSDRAVIAMRRLLLDAVNAFQNDQQDPPGLEDLPYHRIMSESFVLSDGTPWGKHSVLDDQLVATHRG